MMSQVNLDLFDLFPASFNENIYRDNYNDLSGLNIEQLYGHWNAYGLEEGRASSFIESRLHVLEIISRSNSVLEIGPFDNPFVERLRDRVRVINYADYCSTEELLERARNIKGRNSQNVPEINFVVKSGLGTIKQEFHCVVSVQVLEHQPDLIQHLLDVSRIVSKGGVYIFIVPNKTCMFDHFIPESYITEVVAAYQEQRKKPSIRSVIEHRAFSRHNFINCDNPFYHQTSETRRLIENAVSEFKNNDYCDVHCWYFTHKSIRALLAGLIAMEYLPNKARFNSYYLNQYEEIAVVVSFS